MIRKKRQKISIFDFEPIKIIGKGAFGEVRVCRYSPTQDIVAIKKMKKDEMHKNKQVLNVRAEKDVLSEANNPWIVDLKFSFQDQKYLYLGMEFLQGGDLLSLLMDKDILPECDAKFYAAELVLAIENVHKLNCIHRDLKPDNVLIGKDGHIKLSDFGLSKKVDFSIYNNDSLLDIENEINNNPKQNSYAMQFSQFKMLHKTKQSRRAYAFSTVGTPDYIAPEVMANTGYGPEVDWWSLGVIMFEMMIGYPPFFSKTSRETLHKIKNFKSNLFIPEEANISKEAIDILLKFLTDHDKRLGYHGADEVKQHPFFKGINFDKIKETLIPPFIPKLNCEYDTRYFEEIEEDEPFYPYEGSDVNDYKSKVINKDLCFVDFTYKRGDENNYRQGMVSALEVFESLKENMMRINKNNNNKCGINRNGSFVEPELIDVNVNNDNSNKESKGNTPEKEGNDQKERVPLRAEINIESPHSSKGFINKNKDIVMKKNYISSSSCGSGSTYSSNGNNINNTNILQKQKLKKQITTHNNFSSTANTSNQNHNAFQLMSNRLNKTPTDQDKQQEQPKRFTYTNNIMQPNNIPLTYHKPKATLNRPNTTSSTGTGQQFGSKLKGISIKNDYVVSYPKGINSGNIYGNGNKITFPASAVNSTKIQTHIKKDEMSLSTKAGTNRIKFDSAFLYQNGGELQEKIGNSNNYNLNNNSNINTNNFTKSIYKKINTYKK